MFSYYIYGATVRGALSIREKFAKKLKIFLAGEGQVYGLGRQKYMHKTIYKNAREKPCLGALLGINPSRTFYLIDLIERHAVLVYSSTQALLCFIERGWQTAFNAAPCWLPIDPAKLLSQQLYEQSELFTCALPIKLMCMYF